MRVLIVDLYKIIYGKTKAKWPSVIVAIAFITLLNVITIRGLSLLMENWLAPARLIRIIFSFPYAILPAIIIFALNFWLITPIKNLKKERQKQPNTLPILVYTAACAVLVLYSLYGQKIFL